MNAMNCEICGRNIERAFKVDVEGAIMQLCTECSSFGKIIERPKVVVKKVKKENKKEEFVDVIVDDYYIKIKNARELRNLKQKDLANKMAIKESLIHKIESGNIELSLDLAKKFERFLKIKLVEKRKEENIKVKADKNSFTIGDMLNIRD